MTHGTAANTNPLGACLRIDVDAVAHNLQRLRQILGRGKSGRAPRIWAVVKADAYGHAVAHVMPGLSEADGLAVLTLSDAYECRFLGWRKAILIMDALIPSADLNDPALFPLHLIIDRAEQLAELESFKGPCLPTIWLRFTGSLHHAGFDRPGYQNAWRRLEALRAAGRLAGSGHLHHYANAEDPARLAAERQTYAELTANLPGPVCTENSAALLSDPRYAADTDWVRSGIALYGISPLPNIAGPALGLMPAMTLEAPIYAIQRLAAGDALGYGATFRADRDMRVGLLRCGYADGYPRSVPNGVPVLIDGRKSRIVGRVSMDVMAVDLSEHPGAMPGSMVTLWGTADLPVETIALSAGTIAAQLCTGITARVPRLARRIDRNAAPATRTPA